MTSKHSVLRCNNFNGNTTFTPHEHKYMTSKEFQRYLILNFFLMKNFTLVRNIKDINVCSQRAPILPYANLPSLQFFPFDIQVGAED